MKMKTFLDCRRMALAYEKKLWSQGFDFVVGLDEAGRGPLAGPVAAGAVAIIARGNFLAELKNLRERVNDSKKVAPKKREELYNLLTKHRRIVWGVGLASVQEIDALNILEASKLAMERALAMVIRVLPSDRLAKIVCVLDGNFKIASDLEQTSIVGGDSRVFSIAAASIIAKVTRDRIMARLDKAHPGWDFASHKGYPTPRHLRLLGLRAPSSCHRRTFGPVRVALDGHRKRFADGRPAR
jgi:ribonuclease HII